MPRRSYRYKDWALYGQDSLRLTPRLTLNYGLRYEHYGVQHNNHPEPGLQLLLRSGAGIEQQVRAGRVQIADQSSVGQFWAPRWGTFAPRVGFAYDIFGDGKSSLARRLRHQLRTQLRQRDLQRQLQSAGQRRTERRLRAQTPAADRLQALSPITISVLWASRSRKLPASGGTAHAGSQHQRRTDPVLESWLCSERWPATRLSN